MKKLKTTGQIVEYNATTGEFCGYLRTEDRGYMESLVNYVGDKQWAFEFGRYFKKRTTGDLSQNHHYWGHLQQLCENFGLEIYSLDIVVRTSAISWGYPFDLIPTKEGIKKVPWDETRVNTKQYADLLDCLHWFGEEHYEYEFYEGDRDRPEEHSGPEQKNDDFEAALQAELSNS
jgi:hypothetical protein